jgi:hypothetical protein
MGWMKICGCCKYHMSTISTPTLRTRWAPYESPTENGAARNTGAPTALAPTMSGPFWASGWTYAPWLYTMPCGAPCPGQAGAG